MTAMLVEQPFAALAQCPHCDELAVHWLETPKPPPAPEEMATYEAAYRAWREEPRTTVITWTGNVMRELSSSPPPRPPLDESVFEAMRRCVSCGRRWGVL